VKRALLLLLLLGALVPAASASAQAPRAGVSATSSLSAAQSRYLALAEAGVARSARWRDHHLGWFDARLHDHDRFPLATIWDIVPLFESIDAIAIASPTPAHRAAVTSFAKGAERYLNHGLHSGPGYSPYPGDRSSGTETWFDDNGWWGTAFVNAYRATGNRRYLKDAERALGYIARAGWDPRGGGIWWNTEHPYKSGPALASATLLATLLYRETHSAFDLAQAERFLTWANGPGLSGADGLYAGSSINATPVDYIEGPLIYAQALLCSLDGVQAQCARSAQIEQIALRRFGETLDFAPQYDAIYLQWMLALYSLQGKNALYRLASANAADAAANALNGEGLSLLSWGGSELPERLARPGMLQTQAATSSLYAWLAVYPPPS
jgi:hypothetical protein